eukprot:SAG31_NODE_16850_length_693_cov_0.920875_1_plen_179_part_01
MSYERQRREKRRQKIEAEEAEQQAAHRAEREQRESELRTRASLLELLSDCALSQYAKPILKAGLTMAKLRQMDAATIAAQLGRSASGMSLGPLRIGLAPREVDALLDALGDSKDGDSQELQNSPSAAQMFVQRSNEAPAFALSDHEWECSLSDQLGLPRESLGIARQSEVFRGLKLFRL